MHLTQESWQVYIGLNPLFPARWLKHTPLIKPPPPPPAGFHPLKVPLPDNLIILQVNPTAFKCIVPEKIHTHPMEGHRNFLGGEAMYEDKLEFPGGGGCKTTIIFRGGSMDIFWNCTIP